MRIKKFHNVVMSTARTRRRFLQVGRDLLRERDAAHIRLNIWVAPVHCGVMQGIGFPIKRLKNAPDSGIGVTKHLRMPRLEWHCHRSACCSDAFHREQKLRLLSDLIKASLSTEMTCSRNSAELPSCGPRVTAFCSKAVYFRAMNDADELASI